MTYRRRPLTRRAFLRRAAVLSAAVSAPMSIAAPAATRRAWAYTRDAVSDPSGTTLERTIVATGPGPYHRLAYGPARPILVRGDLAAAKTGREGRRRALGTFLHLTDFQLADAQSPGRVEFLDRHADEPTPSFLAAAQRPEEALTVHIVEALVRRANAVAAGPVTGRRFDATVCTGDNLDNKQANELDWYLTLMDGGALAANSGAPDAFEGVQAFDDPPYYDPHYYHPEPVAGVRPDTYKSFYGFPDYPGLLDAAIEEFAATGVRTPWYAVYGNHDALVQGNDQANPAYEAVATGGTKVLHPPPGWSAGDFYRGLVSGDVGALAAISLAPSRSVTPDPERRFVSGDEFVRRHLRSPSAPKGHGFTEDNLDPVRLYYVFDLAEGARGIVLDTTSPRLSEGSIGQAQLTWLEQRLIEVHSRYYDDAGNEVRTGNDDHLVVLVSHHPARAMQPIQGRTEGGEVEQRYGGSTVEDLLHRFPNVILWVNGHTHENRVFARPDPRGRTGGYWDVTTSAQIDPPQQARTIELADNRDGTLSIFTVVVDHAGPPRTEVGGYDVLGLASIGRELAFNDYQASAEAARGEPKDLNTELLVAAPFAVSTSSPTRVAYVPATGR